VKLLAAALLSLAAQAQDARRPSGTESGFGVFQTRCMSCHGNPAAADRAPDPSTLRQFSPERIYAALTTGVMKVHAQNLTDEEKRRVAEFMSARPLGSAELGDAKNMPNHCPGNAALADPSMSPAWNGWAVDVANTRFQPGKAAGLTADQVPRLKLKWAFGYPNGVSASGQPTTVSGRVFVGTDIGYVYSLDAATGCIYWSFKANGLVRNAITIGPVKGRGSAKYAAYFGDAHSNIYAVDAHNGELLWMKHADDHFTARITAAPTLHDGRIYVPVSSSEEWSGSTLDYPCCTFRGSVMALDANTGRQIWKTYTIAEEPKPTKKNSKGVQLWAPAGASVWNSPTVDAQVHAIYFGTGDSETEPAAKTSDAVMALDIGTGKVLWVFQAQENDAFMGGCSGANKTENCPTVQGPDLDIGNSPILRSLPDGRRILLAATKNGNVFALDPDRKGALIWKVNIADNSKGLNGVMWGGATDPQNAYYGLSRGGVVALRLVTGERLWFNPLTRPSGAGRSGQYAAVSVIPGVVFTGGFDGRLNALDTRDGHVMWEFETAREFTTVNQVKAKGGTMAAPGTTIAGGMLFAGSGYGVFGTDQPGNVLLAFSIE
jgi:polyvinyl alcohol dehydrogenase (cytochrome)